MHSSEAALLVIGPAIAGRTRWRPPQDDEKTQEQIDA
jgi:hypothetical protein